MKKLIVIGLLVLTVSANAQFKKGQVLLGGNISLNRSETKQALDLHRSTSISVEPRVAWFKNEKLLYGIGLGYTYQTTKTTPGDQKHTLHGISINGMVQRFSKLTNNFYFTMAGSLTAGYQTGEQKTPPTPAVKNTGYYFGVGLTPGISFRVSERFLLDLSLNDILFARYSTTKTDFFSGSDMKHNSFSLGSSLSTGSLGNVGIGFRYLLRK